PAGSISARTERIPAKHADRHQRSGTRCSSASGCDGIARCIDDRIVRKQVAVLNILKISENALTGLGCQNHARKLLARDKALTIEKKEKECFVLRNRPADPRAELIPVPVVFLRTFEVIPPGVRAQS